MAIPSITLLPVRFHCCKVLPLVYDESLSYYEQLCKVTKHLNDTITAVNDLETAMSDVQNTLTQHTQLLNGMASEITSFESNVNTLLGEINDTLAQYDARFNEYDNRFDELEAELNRKLENNMKALKDYVDETLANVEASVDKVIEKEIQKIYASLDKMEQDMRDEFELEIRRLIAQIPDLTTIEVINPVTGKLSKVQNALDDLFMNTRYNALTVDEWNHLKMDINTANKLLRYSAPTGWSVIDWLTKAKEWLNKNPKLMMHNFITGVAENYKKNVELNNDLLRVCGCLTCAEFAALNITVDGFNEVGATCEELAWKSNRMFA